MSNHNKITSTPDTGINSEGIRLTRRGKIVAGVGALALSFGTGVAVDRAVEASSDHEIGCTNLTVKAGDHNIDPIDRAISELQNTDSGEGFAPRHTSELNRVAESLGAIHAGEELKVCGIEDPLLGDTVSVERTPNDSDTLPAPEVRSPEE